MNRSQWGEGTRRTFWTATGHIQRPRPTVGSSTGVWHTSLFNWADSGSLLLSRSNYQKLAINRCSQKGSTFGKLFGLSSHWQDLEEKRNLKRQRLWPSPCTPHLPAFWCKRNLCHIRKGLETVQVCSGGVDQQSDEWQTKLRAEPASARNEEKKKTERKGKCFWKSEPNKAANPQIIPERGLKEPPAKTREKLDYNWPVSTGFWPFI